MNPLYQSQMMNGFIPAAQPMMPQNPMQWMSFLMQAMQNAPQFVRQAFPDIPDNISNNPGQILQYLQQTRGITNKQIQQVQQTINQIPQLQQRW